MASGRREKCLSAVFSARIWCSGDCGNCGGGAQCHIFSVFCVTCSLMCALGGHSFVGERRMSGPLLDDCSFLPLWRPPTFQCGRAHAVPPLFWNRLSGRSTPALSQAFHGLLMQKFKAEHEALEFAYNIREGCTKFIWDADLEMFLRVLHGVVHHEIRDDQEELLSSLHSLFFSLDDDQRGWLGFKQVLIE